MAEQVLETPTPVAAPNEEQKGRTGFASTIVIGHALKHTLVSGLSSVIVPELKLTLNLSATQVGTLGSVQQISGWFATMAAGYFGDRFTHKTGLLLALSLGFTAAALLLISSANTYAILVLGMLLMGLGPSMFHPPAVGALSRRFADRRAFAISMHGTGGSIGEALGPLVAAGLIAVLFWRDALRVEFVPAIIGAALMWILLRKSHDHQSSSTPPTFRTYLGSFTALLRQRALVLILFVTAFRSVGHGTTTIFLPLYLREDLGYSAGLVGLYISLGQIAGIGSQPLMGFLSDRFGHKRVIVPALLIFAIILGLIPLADGKVQMAIVILALGVFLFSMQSILTSAAVDLAGHEVHSTVVSLIYASSFIGSLAPTFAGMLADEFGYQSTFYFSCTLALVATVLMIVTKLPKKEPEVVPG